MSNSIQLDNVKLWKNEHEGRKGTFYTYSVSISKKMKDGTWKNKGIKLIPKEPIPTNIENGAVVDIDGFLTLDVFEGRNGEVMNFAIFANEIDFGDYAPPKRVEEDYDGYEATDDDIPF